MAGMIWIGVTDNAWFDYLAALQPDEVNFWQPGGNRPFRVLGAGDLFLFKPHGVRMIAGGGYFVRQSFLPLSLAWDAFENRNGAPSFDAFRTRILSYRARHGETERDPVIGCLVLVQPFFFERTEWVTIPEGWHDNIVQGKSFDVESDVGRRLLESVQLMLPQAERATAESVLTPRRIGEQRERYGNETVIRPRLGQGAFRVVVTEAYSRRCAVTGERVLPVLQASHIRPYADNGPHSLENGILLRSDLHSLFDSGYMTITDDYRVEVSEHIYGDYHNGKEYLKLHGASLAVLPEQASDRPSLEYIEWHHDHVYRG